MTYFVKSIFVKIFTWLPVFYDSANMAYHVNFVIVPAIAEVK